MKIYKGSMLKITVLCIISSLLFTIGCERDQDFEKRSNNDFLDLSTYTESEMTPEDLEMVTTALTRLGFEMDVDTNLYKLKYESGTDVNISESLFDYVKATVARSNERMRELVTNSLESSGVHALKYGDQEGQQPGAKSDCVAHSISRQSGRPYEEVRRYLDNKYGGDGVPADKYEEANRHFMPNGKVGNTSNLGHGIQNGHGMTYQINDTTHHAVNMTFYDSNTGLIIYEDRQNNKSGVIHESKVISLFINE